MTKYYFAETNAGYEIFATDGEKMFFINTDSAGVEPNAGINLYDGDYDCHGQDTLKKLRDAYKNIDYLYNMDDIMLDYPGKVEDYDADWLDMIDIIGIIAEVE